MTEGKKEEEDFKIAIVINYCVFNDGGVTDIFAFFSKS